MATRKKSAKKATAKSPATAPATTAGDSEQATDTAAAIEAAGVDLAKAGEDITANGVINFEDGVASFIDPDKAEETTNAQAADLSKDLTADSGERTEAALKALDNLRDKTLQPVVKANATETEEDATGDDQEVQERADAIFAAKKECTELHLTADGFFFDDTRLCKAYVKTLENKKIKRINRN